MVSVTVNTSRSDASAMLIQNTAVSQRMRSVVMGPCVETNDPRGAGKKKRTITLSSTIIAVWKLASRISIAGPQANEQGLT